MARHAACWFVLPQRMLNWSHQSCRFHSNLHQTAFLSLDFLPSNILIWLALSSGTQVKTIKNNKAKIYGESETIRGEKRKNLSKEREEFFVRYCIHIY